MWEVTTKQDASLPKAHPARWMYELWETTEDGVRYWITLSRGFITEDDALDDASRFGVAYYVEHRQTSGDASLGRGEKNRDGGEAKHVFDTSAKRRELTPEES